MEYLKVIHFSKTDLKNHSISISGISNVASDRNNSTDLLDNILSVLGMDNVEAIQSKQLKNDSFIFETCLRVILISKSDILDYSRLNKEIPFGYYSESEAYRFILEIICGLHSDIKGETEIFGQFKNLIKELQENQNDKFILFKATIEQLVTDCKFLRLNWIQNWGSQSYGSITRKKIQGYESLFLIGRGHLAQEIAPWVNKIKNKYLFTRSKITHSYPTNHPKSEINNSNTKNNFSQSVLDGFKFINLNDCLNNSLYLNSTENDNSVLVIAAPISNEDLKKLDLKKFNKIIDWRGESSISKNELDSIEYFHLSELKESIEKNKLDYTQQIQTVQNEIKSMVDRFKNRVIQIPWGWDDISA